MRGRGGRAGPYRQQSGDHPAADAPFCRIYRSVCSAYPAPESPFALLCLLVASAPFFRVCHTPPPVVHAQRGSPTASARAGMAPLFPNPVLPVLLVTDESA